MALDNVNINNVPMDYFLRGAEAARPRNAPQAQAPAPGDANPPEAQPPQDRPHAAARLVSQLDVLLMKAARSSAQSPDGRTVKARFRKLVEDGALGRDSLKLLEKAANTAAKSLKALDRFTGRDLASSFNARGEFVATTKAGKAVAAALQAQQELSGLFAQLGKGLSAMSRHEEEMRAADPRFGGVDAALLEEVLEMRLLCDRRATEIMGLPYRMNGFAAHLAAAGRNADPNVVAILKARVDELLPRQSLAMHGTADALATVDGEVAGRLRPLAERIDRFRNAPSSTLASEEYAALQHDIETMKAALADIRRNGVASGNGRMRIADDLAAALEREVGRAEEGFRTARAEVARTVAANYLATARKIDPRNADAELRNLLADPGIARKGKGELAVDATKIRNKAILHALHETTGAHNLALPDKIGHRTLDSLAALKSGPAREAYLASIRPRLSTGSYAAAVSRLDDVIAHAGKLEREGKVVESDEAWADAREAPLPSGSVTVTKADGRPKRLGGDIAKSANKCSCPSIFVREGLDKLFAV